MTLTIRHYYDSAGDSYLRGPLAILASLLARLAHHESAATISGFAATPVALATFPEFSSAITHLRGVLGDEAYESVARAGATMGNAQIVTYALEQIDEARAQLADQKN